MRYGRLIVIGERRTTTSTGKYRYQYDCLCDCGGSVYKDKSKVKAGFIQSCGCLQREMRKSFGKRVSRDVGEAAFNNVYRTYLNTAAKRDYEFALTKEQFRQIIIMPCIYCGAWLTNTYHKKDHNGDFKYTGIDRYDNDKGYTVENSVPCCRVCNRVKTDMDATTMSIHLQKMLDNKDIWQRTA